MTIMLLLLIATNAILLGICFDLFKDLERKKKELEDEKRDYDRLCKVIQARAKLNNASNDEYNRMCDEFNRKA